MPSSAWEAASYQEWGGEMFLIPYSRRGALLSGEKEPDRLVALIILQVMENTDLLNGIAGGLAIAIFIGGLLMMFTSVWTTKKK